MEEFENEIEAEEPKSPKARVINKNKLPKKARNLRLVEKFNEITVFFFNLKFNLIISVKNNF